MSESLTINTLNQGHFTHTHTHTLQPYTEARMGPGGGGVREGEPRIKKGKAPFRGPGGR